MNFTKEEIKQIEKEYMQALLKEIEKDMLEYYIAKYSREKLNIPDPIVMKFKPNERI